MTILEAATLLRARKISAVELTQSCLDRIDQLNPKVNAFLTVTRESALAQAEAADQRIAAGNAAPLTGIPIAHKDIVYTKGIRTTGGSKVFANFIPDFSAPLVTALESQGAVMIGKTGLHELAYGITSNNPHYGAVRNPWNLDCVPGGSSGGSAAALATGMCFMATGSDTGGSIRIPGSFCGVGGLKPTYEKISRHGVLPLAFSLDHLGPMARTVRDNAICYDAMTGESTPLPPEGARLDGVRIGIPTNAYYDIIDPEVDQSIRAAARNAAALGAQIIDVTLPDLEQMNAVTLVIQLAESTAANANHMDRRELLGDDVWVLLNQGRLVPGYEYVNAQRLRRRIQQDFNRVFDQLDMLMLPSTPNTAPKIGQTTVTINGIERDTRLLTTRCARSINLLGLPALVIPCGLSSANLPIGLQLVGPANSESSLIRSGATLEDVLPRLGTPPIP